MDFVTNKYVTLSYSYKPLWGQPGLLSSSGVLLANTRERRLTEVVKNYDLGFSLDHHLRSAALPKIIFFTPLFKISHIIMDALRERMEVHLIAHAVGKGIHLC
jgi:hypothetical protein